MIRRFWRDDSGSVIAEFLIISPVFLVLVLFIFSLGTTLMLRYAAIGTARDIARDYAMNQGTNYQQIAGEMVREQSKGTGELQKIVVTPTGDEIRVSITVQKTGFVRSLNDALRKWSGAGFPDSFTYTIVFPR